MLSGDMVNMQAEQRGVLRPLQPDGHYLPIPSCFPAVKQPSAAGMEGCVLHKRPPPLHQQENQPKRAKLLQGVDGKQLQPAVAELLGRQAGALDSVRMRLPFSHVTSRDPNVRDAEAVNKGASARTATAVTTFLDITQHASKGELGDTVAMEAHKTTLLSMRLPSNAASRPPLAPSTADNNNNNNLTGHAAGDAAMAAAEVVVQQCLPYDWALKASARFSTTGRFTCYDVSITASTKHDTCCPRQTWAELPAQERWLVGLASWQHPADGSMAPSNIAALQAAAPELLARRLDTWRVALTSAYMAVRHGQCPALYVDSAQGARHPCTILFTAAGARGCSQVQGLLSCSSAQQRSRMHAAGLEFSMPIAPQHQQVQHTIAAEGSKDMGGDAATAAVPDAVLHVRDFSPQSLLLFQGAVQVHMLFDWLLQEVGFNAQQGGDTADVPLLLAPVPFKNACCHKPEVKSMYGLAGNSAHEGQQGQVVQQQQQHVLEVSGPLPPWTLTRMCAALAEAATPQQQFFQADFVTQTHSLALNVWPVDDSGSSSTQQAGGAAEWELAPGEGKAASKAPVYLSQRVVHRILAEPSVLPVERGATACPTQYMLKLSG